MTGYGGTQTLTATELSCGTLYSFEVTCTDEAGNSATHTTARYSTLSCDSGAGSTGGGAGTTTTYTKTYFPSETELSTGYSKQVSAKERVKVLVGTQVHFVGVKSLSSTKATIEISSNPVEVQLDVGEETKVDVDNDGDYDVYVILNSITNAKADVTIKTISEAIPAGGSAVYTTGEVASEEGGQDETTTEEGGSSWIWIIIAVLIVAAIAGGIVYKKRK